MRSGIFPPGAGCSSLLSGLATGLSWLCYFHALQIGQASRVIPIDKFSVVISMVLAFVVLREAVTVTDRHRRPAHHGRARWC